MTDYDGSRDPWRYSAVGIEFTILFLAFVLGGYWVDDHFGVLPANTVLGAALGFGLALWRLLRQVKRLKDCGSKQDIHDKPDDNRE